MRSPKAAALASFVFTYVFFFEYIPPVRWAHIPYDLNGFHYPLADYAFQRLRQGHFPLWDPTIYCGMSFVGNIQAALFYPPTWIMFLFNWGRERLSYQSMEDLQIAHVWLGFFLCYLWLRGKRLAGLACVMGALVFAFSGYMCTQLQHFGLVAAYIWIPLALWGIDQAVERRSWLPLWKVAAASALAFLAGYPPTWVAFALVVVVYSLAGAWRAKAATGTIAAIAFSLVLCAVQLLPTWETTALRSPELRYGDGIRHWDIVLSYVLPNYFNFGLNMPVDTNSGKDYFYLGVPVLLGLPFLVLRRRFRELVPSLAMLAATLVAAGNPFDLVWNVIRHSTLLSDIMRDWYLLAGVTLAFAPLTAYALDEFLSRKTRPAPAWLMPLSAALMALWGLYELYRWKSQSFAAGWRSGIYLLVTLAIFLAGMYAFRAGQGRRRMWMAVALILFVGVDYKAFGTSKRFDAGSGDAQRWSFTSLPGMSPDVYRQLRANSDYRIVSDFDAGPLPDDFRHIGLTTPQGFDPLLTTSLRKMVEAYGRFRTDRMFEIDPKNYDAMRLFGAKYVISSEYSKQFPEFKDNPQYRLLGSTSTFYKVYEYLDAQPPYSWEGSAADTVERRAWEPEDRTFQVRTASGGKLALHEQFFPGWEVTIDGKNAALEPWGGAFQAVAVPAGEHTVEFHYRSRLLALGGGISLLALVGLFFWIRANSRSTSDTAYRAVSG
ncbi:MAG TPA: YfhO family protein [Bryobacteraceae bacterium]|nr:YfhO family protein [Bryobacteraceae bacterium]